MHTILEEEEVTSPYIAVIFKGRVRIQFLVAKLAAQDPGVVA
jgi:hypothetical protein